MIHFLLRRRHFYTVRLYLERRAPDLAGHVRLVAWEDALRARTLPAGTWIFSDLDRLSKTERAFAALVHDALAGAGGRARTVNDPRATLRRSDLLRTLHEDGINAFRAFPAGRVDPACRFPVFVREADEHHGSLTPLLRSHRELRAALRRLRLRGYRRSELLVVEFLDCRSPDGLYRKYAAFRVGPEILARSLGASGHWVVKHGDSAADPALIEEERRYVMDNPHEDRLRELFDLAGVEYGRIDYALGDGRVQVWEINLNPTIGPSPRKGPRPPDHERLRPLREPARSHFHARFRDALLALDDATAGEDIGLPRERLLRTRARLEALGLRARRGAGAAAGGLLSRVRGGPARAVDHRRH
ncbi:MAG TPA: hypothetical protein VML95_11355 [Longimicrobiales bacterium]|nr:hypothetical protein [Longimicrobiales bacterium]